MPQAPLSQLKAEALGLAGALGSLTTRARAASSAYMGSAGRRRSGTGENFWQYRRHTQEDGVERIDWRRSAREEHLFVRETELETARTFLFWVDPSDGFGWSSDNTRVTKADRATVIAMALAGALARAGERCGVLGAGRTPSSGAKALTRVGEGLRDLKAEHAFPEAPRDNAAVIIAGDFYSNLETWRERLAPIAARCRDGALLQVVDPIEASYPFDGRVKFYRPGEGKDRLIGRAQAIKEEYLTRFEQRRKDLTQLAGEIGWRFVSHPTSEPVMYPLGILANGFETEAGARR